MKQNKPSKKRAPKFPKHLQHLNHRAAGIDVGSRSHFVAVPEGADEQPVREFSTFTDDLERLAQWLISCGVTTVAMESTGIYWIPVFEILERHGLEIKLVNARHVKNVPGRKSDVLDCQWLQQLHTYGLLRGAFRPADQVCTLRAYVRQRATLVRSASSHIQRMQKALAQMNLQLHNVVTDITGVTGMGIIKAILAGERHPQRLAALRDKRCKNSQATIARSLHGNYRSEHLFSLQQAVDLYEFHQQKIADCDQRILEQLSQFDTSDHPDSDGTPPGTMEEALQRRSGVRSVQHQRHQHQHGPENHRRNWNRHEPLAERQTVHVLAGSVPRIGNQRRQGSEQRHQARRQSGRRRIADGGHDVIQFQERVGRLFAATTLAPGSAQVDHRNRAQTGAINLQHAQARHGVC
jgi:hypothetical protein